MIRSSLASLCVAGVILTLRFAFHPLAPVTLVVAPAAVASPSRGAGSPAAETLDRLVSRDPFRPGRRPAPVAYGPIKLAQSLAPQTPKPVLVLDGIAWTPGDAEAVLEGLPGADGPRVVRPGDVVGGLRVRRIAADRVIVTGVDTTWTLTVRKP